METEKNIYQRMSAVMGDLDSVTKSDKIVNGQYGFVAHDAVTKALHPLCVEHGIHIGSHVEEWVQVGNRTELTLAVRFTNIDDPADAIMVKALGFGIDGSDKGPGKAVSYALKTCLLKQFLLEAGEYDNENTATDHKPQSSGASDAPRRMNSNRAGTCGICGVKFPEGEEIAYRGPANGQPAQVAHWNCYEGYRDNKPASEQPASVNDAPPVEDDLPF